MAITGQFMSNGALTLAEVELAQLLINLAEHVIQSGQPHKTRKIKQGSIFQMAAKLGHASIIFT